MSASVFPGEALAGAVVLLAGLWMSLGARVAGDIRIEKVLAG
jgi:hypothetical protein